jgi:UDP-N-acetylmuramyl tripeptide synthase
LIALNDEIADGRDVSWIWDVDFEPLIGSLQELVVSGSRAQELALRFKYGGLDPARIVLIPDLGEALAYGVETTPAGGELVVLPTYTAMLALRQIASEQGLVRPYWEEAAA